MVDGIITMSNKSKISALVINLSTATERWEFQKKQLNTLGIKYQRWEAAAVSNITTNEYEKWANDWQRKLRRTEVACFLSHYQVWQHIANSAQSFLILEDDVMLSQNLLNVLDTLSTQPPTNYHHLNFETRGRKKLIGKQGIHIGNDIALHDLFLDKTGAAAYLLTPKGAQILLDAVEKSGAGLADALLCHTKPLKSMQSVPALAIQMDMADRYNILGLVGHSAAKSNISDASQKKPIPNSIIDTINFKTRRLSMQLQIGAKQLKYKHKSEYLELVPDITQFEYLNTTSC